MRTVFSNESTQKLFGGVLLFICTSKVKAYQSQHLYSPLLKAARELPNFMELGRELHNNFRPVLAKLLSMKSFW